MIILPKTYNRDTLFQQHAPNFNFELDRDQLVLAALEMGFITRIEGDEENYLVNQDY